MSYVILDLEWNGSYSRELRKFINEIIEFGAVKTDDEFNITDTFSVLISPQIGKKLCGKVKELTKITNEDLKDNGISFLDAVSQFTDFLNDGVLLTWGTSDIHVLIENYSYYAQNNRLPFLRKYCDLQAYCEKCLGLQNPSSQLGLSACAELLGIKFAQNEQHRAFADAELSFKCLSHLISETPLDSFIMNADCVSFYDRIMFKNHYITNLQSSEIDKEQMKFLCDCCGEQAKRMTRWRIYNKSFTAEFLCKNCGRNFLGRVAFKKKYDCVSVKKKIIEKKQKATENESSSNAKVM